MTAMDDAKAIIEALPPRSPFVLLPKYRRPLWFWEDTGRGPLSEWMHELTVHREALIAARLCGAIVLLGQRRSLFHPVG